MQALQIIRGEHASLWRLILTIEQITGEIENGAPVNRALFESIFEYFASYVDVNHHRKEDDYLFRLLKLRSPDMVPLIDKLQTQHAAGSGDLATLRVALVNAAQDKAIFVRALRAYTGALKEHIATEERDLMPVAQRALTTADWEEVDRAFLNNADPVFGENARAQYRDLFHRVANLAPESVGLGSHSLEKPERAAPQKGRPLLEVEGLETSYGRVKALKGVSLQVNEGELVALVGANGAGKTTLLRTLSGVLPQDAGVIKFAGKSISKLAADVRMKLGICQSPEGRQVFGPMSIEDNLRLGAYTQPREQIFGDLEKIYAMFPILAEKKNLQAGTLSGGQQQMLAIGRALMGRPKLLLLDEPSMGLSPLLVQDVFGVITDLKRQGMTILLVEQNASAALAIADRAYVLETGAVSLEGSGADLLKNPLVMKAYLGM